MCWLEMCKEIICTDICEKNKLKYLFLIFIGIVCFKHYGSVFHIFMQNNAISWGHCALQRIGSYKLEGLQTV